MAGSRDRRFRSWDLTALRVLELFLISTRWCSLSESDFSDLSSSNIARSSAASSNLEKREIAVFHDERGLFVPFVCFEGDSFVGVSIFVGDSFESFLDLDGDEGSTIIATVRTASPSGDGGWRLVQQVDEPIVRGETHRQHMRRNRFFSGMPIG